MGVCEPVLEEAGGKSVLCPGPQRGSDYFPHRGGTQLGPRDLI